MGKRVNQAIEVSTSKLVEVGAKPFMEPQEEDAHGIFINTNKDMGYRRGDRVWISHTGNDNLQGTRRRFVTVFNLDTGLMIAMAPVSDLLWRPDWQSNDETLTLSQNSFKGDSFVAVSQPAALHMAPRMKRIRAHEIHDYHELRDLRHRNQLFEDKIKLAKPEVYWELKDDMSTAAPHCHDRGLTDSS